MSLLDKIEHSISLTNSSEEEKNVLRVMYCRQYLKETDYAIIKMYENVVQGGSILKMLEEYKEILSNRKEARELINELEG
jgi:calcineurin-like phosphoesterase family protein